ncbi:acyl-CoA dehydrogenase family protein [Nocardia violaceofusca]|uniref:acyl-CoA dehydrogenase family protein n=1 Tax=Nocardia violaceofusca TaxID=941182 RepID=UPI0007A4961B|nr:acyl-CoA dehydrogenase family protein [Nocardia violaceofusca]
MNIDLSREAADYGREASRAIAAAGGDRLIQDAEAEPSRRADIVAPMLAGLGAWELDPRRDRDDLEAAAALCRSAGYWALPYPLAERLARPLDAEADGLVVVTESRARGAVADLDLCWAAVTVEGKLFQARTLPDGASPRTSAFVTPLALTSVGAAGSADAALPLTLNCWTLLGMLDRALDLTRSHVLMRTQFGQPLAKFQGVQFQLTDAEVERSGLDVLAKYALWSVRCGGEDALGDALAARVAALDAAETVFRVAHQLHGAIGFCDESPLSWLSRYSLPLRRLPWASSGTLDRLTRHLGAQGLPGPFDGGEAVDATWQ